MHQERLLGQLRGVRDEISELEPDEEIRRQLREAQLERDRLILRALGAGIPDRAVAESAGVTRMWVWKLKKAAKNDS